jgi:hypothetical protein
VDSIAPSPFIAGTNIQYAWDSTSLGYLKQCPRLYQYIIIDGWEPRDESIHLRFGIEYHKALENYDKLISQGLTHDDAVLEVVREILYSTHDWDPDPTTPAGAKKNKRSLVATVVWYLDEYEEDAAVVYERPDGTPAVELSFRFELDYGPISLGGEVMYVLCGHLDKVVKFNDEFLGLDHKTTSRPLSDWYFVQYEPNNQMSFYTISTKVVFNVPIKGIIVDAARVDPDKPPEFQRRVTYRSDDQLNEWLHDLAKWLHLAERYAVEGYWPQNDTACDKYGGCRFRGICSKSPQARERFLQADFIKHGEHERWNPLKIRSSSSGEMVTATLE